MAQKRTGFRLFAVVLVLAVLAVAGWLYARDRGRSEESPYRTAAVDRGTIRVVVTATGTLAARTTVQVGSQVSGVISALHADFNSPVKKGQLLAELDPTPIQAQVEQRRADLTVAKVDLANVQRTLARDQRLAAEGIVAQSELDASQAARDAAAARVTQAQAALRQAETNLGYTKIRSPIDGVVAERQYDIGQTVAASFQAPTLFTIAQDLTQMEVSTDVDQADIGRVAVGQEADFTVDAYPDEVFHGTISEIRLNATTNQNVVTYPVIVRVENPELRLRPKMTADVTIEVGRRDDVVRVPNAALRFRPPEDAVVEGAGGAAGTPSVNGRTAPSPGRPTGTRTRPGSARPGGAPAAAGEATAAVGRGQSVYEVDGKALRPLHLRVGATDGRYTEVVSGDVSPGDEVVVGTATTRGEAASPGFSRMGRRF